MKRLLTAMLGIAAVCALSATTALAAPVNVRPVTVNPGTETPLQTVFTNIGSTINVNTEQEVWAYFTTQAAGISAAQMIVEIAGNAATNEYGIYKLGDPSTHVTVFDGTDAAGTKVAINFSGGDVNVFDFTHSTLSPTISNFGTQFGFYLKTNATTFFYSDDALNGGAAQALVYTGKGDDVMLQGNVAPLNDLNHMYLAWEDLLGGDYDYNDGVFIVESVTGVPEPGLIGLLGMGFFGLATSLRRRRHA